MGKLSEERKAVAVQLNRLTLADEKLRSARARLAVADILRVISERLEGTNVTLTSREVQEITRAVQRYEEVARSEESEQDRIFRNARMAGKAQRIEAENDRVRRVLASGPVGGMGKREILLKVYGVDDSKMLTRQQMNKVAYALQRLLTAGEVMREGVTSDVKYVTTPLFDDPLPQPYDDDEAPENTV